MLAGSQNIPYAIISEAGSTALSVAVVARLGYAPVGDRSSQLEVLTYDRQNGRASVEFLQKSSLRVERTEGRLLSSPMKANLSNKVKNHQNHS